MESPAIPRRFHFVSVAELRLRRYFVVREAAPKGVTVWWMEQVGARRAPATRHRPLECGFRRRYVVCVMRDEERYWVKVSLTIGFVVLVLLLLLISGIIGSMEHIVTTILEAAR
jgi:hypothetical protein